MSTLTKMNKKLQKGATMVEYAIMVAVIAIVVIVGATAVGIQTNAKLMEVCQVLNDGTACEVEE